MREIPWDDKVATKTYTYYKDFTWPYNSRNKIWCNVAESLVEVYYGLEPHLSDLSDNGTDMNLDGTLVDIKCCCREYKWFNTKSSRWSIKCATVVNAINNKTCDYYLFVQIDKNSKKIALIGYLTPTQILSRGKKVAKGEEIYCGCIADTDQYLIELDDLITMD